MALTTIGTAAIDDDAITTDKILGRNVTAAKIAEATIGAFEIQSGAVDTAEIATDAVTATEIAADAVGTAEIAADAVGASELANDSVASANIIDGAIVNADLNASAAIDATKIADGTVTSAEFQYINTLSSNAQTQISATVTVANAALPKAGGTMSGALQMADQLVQRPTLKDYAETSSAEGSVTGTVNIDMTYGNVVTATIITGTTTLNFINPPVSGTAGTITLLLTNGGSQTITWDPQIDWAGGTAPTLTAAGIDILTFITQDAGTIWYGFAAGLAMA